MTIRSTKIGLAALIAATISGAAYAQSMDTTTPTDPALSAPAEMQAQGPAAPETMGDLMADLNGPGVAAPMGTVPPDATVETRTLSELQGEGAENAQALDTALSRAQTQLDMLQTQVDSDATLSAAIEDEGFTSDDVLGVYQTAEGTVTVLIDDRA